MWWEQCEGQEREAHRGEDSSLCPPRQWDGKVQGWGALRSAAGVSDSDLWPQGVVPYLGTFLKDLVMLDAASKDELKVSGVCVQGDDGTSGLRVRQTSQEGAPGMSTEVSAGFKPDARVLVLLVWQVA